MLVSGALAEALIRTIAPEQLIQSTPDVWAPEDSVGYALRPNLKGVINTGERTVDLITDQDGFRIGRGARPTGATNVLLLGDSFMAALQVEYEQSLAGLIETGLPPLIGRGVVVRNTGVPGWGPSEYFIRGRQLLKRGSFALAVVAIYVGNDATTRGITAVPPIVPVEPSYFHLPHGLSWPALIDAFFRPLNDFLESRSHLFIFLKTRLQSVLMRIGLTPEYFPIEYRRSEASSPRWSTTGDICAQLAAESTAHGAPIVFLLIPSQFQVVPAAFHQYVRAFRIDSATVDLDQPNTLLNRELTKRGLTVVDAIGPLRKAEMLGKRTFGLVDRHLSPAGHQVIWDLLAPALADRLRLTR